MSTKNTLRVSFTILEKQVTQMLRLKAKITPNKTATKTSQEKVFSGLFYKVRKNCDLTKPYNKSLINLVCSICTGKYCLRFLSYENLRQYFPIQTSHSVNKSLISQTVKFYFCMGKSCAERMQNICTQIVLGPTNGKFR